MPTDELEHLDAFTDCTGILPEYFSPYSIAYSVLMALKASWKLEDFTVMYSYPDQLVRDTFYLAMVDELSMPHNLAFFTTL